MIIHFNRVKQITQFEAIEEVTQRRGMSVTAISFPSDEEWLAWQRDQAEIGIKQDEEDEEWWEDDISQ